MNIFKQIKGNGYIVIYCLYKLMEMLEFWIIKYKGDGLFQKVLRRSIKGLFRLLKIFNMIFIKCLILRLNV